MGTVSSTDTGRGLITNPLGEELPEPPVGEEGA